MYCKNDIITVNTTRRVTVGQDRRDRKVCNCKLN